MSETEMSFSVKVNTNIEYEAFTEDVHSILQKMNIEINGIIETEDNRIIIRKNEHYSPSKLSDEDGWLFYPYEINVMAKGTATAESQAEVAQMLSEHLIQKGWKITITGGFEHLT